MRLARLGALAVLASLVAGCLDASVPSAAPTPTRAPDPTPTVTTYQLGTTVWYEGLLLHFDQAIATLDDRGGPVQVMLRFENPEAEAGELDGGIHLVIDGKRLEPNRDSRIPAAPPNAKVDVLLTYELQGVASADAAMIEIGVAPQHLAYVPLTPAAGAAVVYAPVPFGPTGSATAADLRITLHDGLLRWDLPDWSQELTADLAALTLSYDVTYSGSFSGGLPFTFDNVALRLPDGKVVGPRRDGHSQSLDLIGPGKTKKALISRFEIPSGAKGKFALLVRNGGVEKAIPFTVPG
jgi:hypothetical protein